MRSPNFRTIKGEVIDVSVKLTKMHKYKIVTIVVPIDSEVNEGEKVEIHIWR